jgi:hypothetical protein
VDGDVFLFEMSDKFVVSSPKLLLAAAETKAYLGTCTLLVLGNGA